MENGILLQYDFSFFLLIGSTIMITALFFFILKMKNKSQIHFVFMANIGLILIWCIAHIFEVITTNIYQGTLMLFVNIYYFGLCFLPFSLLLTGLIFEKTRLKFSFRFVLLLLLPLIDYISLVTNEFHHLYFVKYSIYSTHTEFGPLFIAHVLISYSYIIFGLFYLTRFSIKNSGFFSKQSILIILGISLPFIMNILLTLNLLDVPVYFTPISFSIAIVCFAFAIIKLDFLNIAPIALQKIVDLISDSYIVVNKKFEIIDFNKTFIDTFSEAAGIKRKANLIEVIQNNKFMNLDVSVLISRTKEAIDTRKTVSFEVNIIAGSFNRFFDIEITPIFINDSYTGTIILLKDITQSKKDLEIIKSSQAIIMEQERLSSLGQLIGGIAHNLRTPIMSLSGGIERLKDLVLEYKQSLGDSDIIVSDHHEIADEMDARLEKMKPYCSYMSDIISTVKGLAVQQETSSKNFFTLGELIKRVELLMKHELNVYHVELKISFELDVETRISGGISSLVQIFDNIIINSIHSYSGEHGLIELLIKKENENVMFCFTDYGSGISKSIRDKLFKQMVTTKGNKGTGLGLYMSYATIKGNFNGDMWFESEKGTGTKFFISIPYLKDVAKEEELL